MRRRALLRGAAVGLALSVAGCGGGDETDETTSPATTTTTATTRTEAPDPTGDPSNVTSTAPLIDSDMDALKLRVEELPGEEDWAFQREDDNTTRFERTVELTSYRLVATVLAHGEFETAVTTYREERDQADEYRGITVSDVDLAAEAFGYQLTDDEGTVVFRDANVVGELTYGLGQFESGRGKSTGLGEVVDYARTWHETWR